MNAAAVRGMNLVIELNCVQCHNGVNLSGPPLPEGEAAGSSAALSVSRSETGSLGGDTRATAGISGGVDVVSGASAAGGVAGAAAAAGDSVATGATAAVTVGTEPSAREAGMGMRTVSPRANSRVALKPFAASRRFSVTPLAAAMLASVSPRRARCAPSFRCTT